MDRNLIAENGTEKLLGVIVDMANGVAVGNGMGV
jgi:hypothetical protein